MLYSGKKFRALRDKKVNIRTLVLSEKKILNQTKNHNIYKNIYYKNKLYEKENTCWSPGVRSLFRRPIIPTAHFTDNPLFRQKWSKVV
jgi:hypothetical protein